MGLFGACGLSGARPEVGPSKNREIRPKNRAKLLILLVMTAMGLFPLFLIRLIARAEEGSRPKASLRFRIDVHLLQKGRLVITVPP
jgi:hypothetical protein